MLTTYLCKILFTQIVKIFIKWDGLACLYSKTAT